MEDIVIPNGMEQVSDAEALACVLLKMVDDGDDQALISDEGPIVSISDIALMLCDITRANRLGVGPSPATRDALVVMQASLAVYRAINRGD